MCASPHRYGIALTNRLGLQNEFECHQSLSRSPRLSLFSTLRSSNASYGRTFQSSYATDCVAQHLMILPLVLMLIERYKLAKCVRA